MRAVHSHPDPVACEMKKSGSRNERVEKALIGRTQWKGMQPLSLDGGK
jgi:hypothetical protein